jgi:hypothetical protein
MIIENSEINSTVQQPTVIDVDTPIASGNLSDQPIDKMTFLKNIKLLEEIKK